MADAAAADRPVLMVVQAEIRDPARHRQYLEALVVSGLFETHGAVPLASGPAFDALEGDFPPGAFTAVIRFPSRSAAQAFWDCDAYREIARLREAAGDFRVGLWRQFPGVAA